MNRSFLSQSLSYDIPQGRNYLLLFLFWPFLAFISALTNFNQKEAKKVVYIFFIYYGLTFVLSNVGADSEGYARKLIHYAELPFSDFFEMVGGLYTDTSVDIIEPLVSFVVTRFSSYHGLAFAVWAAIYGFFYLKSINLLYVHYRENPGWNAMIFMVFFVMILPITAIAGVRMWTATWIFLFGAYHVILYRDARYLILALASSLVHWSFLSANAVLFIYFIAGNRNLIYLPIAISSFILPHLITPVFQTISHRLGGTLQARYDMYSSENYVIGRQGAFEEVAWFVRLTSDMVLYYLLFVMVIIQLGSLMKEKAEKNLFSFLLLFLAFVNFGKGIPSFGGRFQSLFILFATIYVFLYFIKLPGKKINLLTVIGLFPMLLYAALQFRNGADSINVWIFTPGLGLPLLVPGLSIADFLFN